MVNINLTNDQALVLFEFLKRLYYNEYEGLFEDKSEEFVLWQIEAILDKQMIEPFKKNYKELLLTARNSIKEKF